jgi:hypothetical protein
LGYNQYFENKKPLLFPVDKYWKGAAMGCMGVGKLGAIGILLFLACCFALQAVAGEAHLEWDPSISKNVVGYRIYVGNNSRNYGAPITVINQTSYTVTGLTSHNDYYFSVTAFDNNGMESQYSDEISLPASSPRYDAPVISNVVLTDVSSKNATVSWVTDKPSSSQIDYQSANEASKSLKLDRLETNHALILSELKKLTTYRFRLTSADDAGSTTNSVEYSLTTPDNAPEDFVLPHLKESVTGLAVTNPDPNPISLSFSAVSAEGTLLRGQNITNPNTRILESRGQLPILDSEIFGYGDSNPNLNYWIKMSSPSSNLNGFFLMFSPGLEFMDGASFAETPEREFVFTEIEPSGQNSIFVVNNNPEYAFLSLEFMGADGSVLSSINCVIRPNGTFSGDLFHDWFIGVIPNPGFYIRASSSQPLKAFMVTRQGMGDITALAGQPLGESKTVLFSPQYAVGGSWRTALSIINLDNLSGSVTIRLYGEEGTPIGTAQTLEIPAHGKIYIDNPNFFQVSDPATVLAGYVKIVSNSIRITGSTVFGDRNLSSFCSALPLVSDLRTSMLFSHLASDNVYYTGIAIINPNAEEVSAVLTLYRSDGSVMASTTVSVPAGGRKSRLLTEFFPNLAGATVTSGYLQLTASLPVGAFSLFGTHSLSVLSAIPPQILSR